MPRKPPCANVAVATAVSAMFMAAAQSGQGDGRSVGPAAPTPAPVGEAGSTLNLTQNLGAWTGLAQYDIAVDLTPLRPAFVSSDVQNGPCELPAGSGSVSGVCKEDISALQELIPFCADSVRYRACVPADQPLWPTWTATRKDAMLAALFKTTLEARLAKEMNNTPHEYVPIHFLANPECMAALKNVLCWYNFPKCSDENVSLPLCRTSCEQYYAACRYTPLAGSDEPPRFPFCQADRVASDGLFGSGYTGPDQRLAEDDYVCPSTEEKADAVLDDKGDAAPWIIREWYGRLIIAVGGVLFFILAFYILMPAGLQAYLTWGLKRLMVMPLIIYDNMPTIKGKHMLVATFLVFLGLMIGGIFRQAQGRMPTTTTPPPEDTIFKPPVATFKIETKGTLTNKQLHQLIGSCSCTGGAPRAARPRVASLFLGAAAAAFSCGALVTDGP